MTLKSKQAKKKFFARYSENFMILKLLHEDSVFANYATVISTTYIDAKNRRAVKTKKNSVFILLLMIFTGN